MNMYCLFSTLSISAFCPHRTACHIYWRKCCRK